MLLEVKNPTSTQVDELLEEWKTDSKIDILEPSKELKKIPALHSKYLTILSTHRRALKEVNRTMAKLKRLKYEYYTGRLTDEQLKKYNWAPFLYTLKGDLNTYMDSDPDILGCKRIMDIHEEIVENCTMILKELGSRTYQLRDIVSWERFIGGQ